MADQENSQKEKLIYKDQTPNQKYQFDILRKIQVWGYAVGHFYNDLCCAIWFNYLLFFLVSIKKLDTIAPYAMLAGQIADAIANPLVGFFSDKTNTRIGKRMPWYIAGQISVTLTFLPIFLPLLPNDAPDWLRTAYFITFPALFNLAWAAGYIAHISLVPQITCSRQRRDLLNGRRNTFTFFSNLTVLLISLLFFQFLDTNDSFLYLAIVTCSIGCCTSAFFMFQIKEVPLSLECQKFSRALLKIVKQQQQDQYGEAQTQNQNQNQSIKTQYSTQAQENYSIKMIKHVINSSSKIMSQRQSVQEQTQNPQNDNEFSDEDQGQTVKESQRGSINYENKLQQQSHLVSKVKGSMIGEHFPWQNWFKEILFYQCAFIYMGAKLYSNVLASLINFYLVYVLDYATEEELASKTPLEVAAIPLILYVSSVAFSSVIEKLFLKIGRKKTFSLGGFFMIGSSIGLFFLTPENREIIYLLAFLIGGAQALVLNTGISLISEVIGVRGNSGAFVFGCYSFLDKIACGIALFIITALPSFKQSEFTRYACVFVPAVSCMLAWVLVLVQKSKELQENQMMKQQEMEGIEKQFSLEDELAN